MAHIFLLFRLLFGRRICAVSGPKSNMYNTSRRSPISKQRSRWDSGRAQSQKPMHRELPLFPVALAPEADSPPKTTRDRPAACSAGYLITQLDDDPPSCIMQTTPAKRNGFASGKATCDDAYLGVFLLQTWTAWTRKALPGYVITSRATQPARTNGKIKIKTLGNREKDIVVNKVK